MCAQRILRSGPGADVVRSRSPRRVDERQGALDLDSAAAPGATRSEQTIYRLAREVAELRLKLAGASATSSAEGVTYRAYTSAPGWSDTVDPIALLARGFAARLAEVKCIRTLGPAGDALEDDARTVNAYIAMIAEEADTLIAALIEDAEAAGLEATGAWMRIPLVGCQKFEAVQRDPDLDRADDIHDEKLNS